MPRPRTHIQLEKCKIADPYQTLALYLLKDALDHLDDEENLRWVAKAGPTFHFWCRIADVEPKAIIGRACSLLGIPLPEHECTQQAIINSPDSMRQSSILSQLRQTGILSGAGGAREAEELLEHTALDQDAPNQVHPKPPMRQTGILLAPLATERAESPMTTVANSMPVSRSESTKPKPQIHFGPLAYYLKRRRLLKLTPSTLSPRREAVVALEDPNEVDWPTVPAPTPQQLLFAQVMDRDEEQCRYCGAEADVLDHVVPRCLGGGTTFGNLVACCTSCNSKKRAGVGGCRLGGFYLRIRTDRASFSGELCYRKRGVHHRGLFGESLWDYVKQDRAAVLSRGKMAGKPRKELTA